MEKPEFKELTYPGVRYRLIEHIRSLADKDHQRRSWVENQHPAGTFDNFDGVVHFFFDDTALSDDPHRYIGECLYDLEEVNLVARIVQSLEHVFTAVGLDATDEEYIASIKWPAVIDAANAFLEYIRDNP